MSNRHPWLLEIRWSCDSLRLTLQHRFYVPPGGFGEKVRMIWTSLTHRGHLVLVCMTFNSLQPLKVNVGLEFLLPWDTSTSVPSDCGLLLSACYVCVSSPSCPAIHTVMHFSSQFTVISVFLKPNRVPIKITVTASVTACHLLNFGKCFHWWVTHWFNHLLIQSACLESLPHRRGCPRQGGTALSVKGERTMGIAYFNPSKENIESWTTAL